MGREHKESDGLIAVHRGSISYGKEIPGRLAHLAVIHIDMAVMKPIVSKITAVGGFTLSDLIFVVGEDQIYTAAMNINGFA